MDIKVTDSTEAQVIKPMLASFSSFINTTSYNNPWSSSDIDKMEFDEKSFPKLIQACRFFYKKDPIVSSTINKLVEIGINELQFNKNGLSDNEFRIFLGLKDPLEEFAEAMALEYLISGLVVPEIKYGRVGKEQLKVYGIKKYDTLILPVTMFLRNPENIVIKANPLGDKPSFFLKIDDELIYFIKNNGRYSDGTEDKEKYNLLATYFPDFVAAVKAGVILFPVSPEMEDLIIRRKPQTNDPTPTPYLSAALESLKHKRNLRRMDYTIASRVIGAIQLFKLGNDEYPVTEDDKDAQFSAVKEQMTWRNTGGRDVERIFQLFANHTLQVEWIVPDTEALLNEQKYISVNQDIIYALGFPRILITGETERSSTSEPQYAMMSPARTMDNFRKQILAVIRKIVDRIAEENRLKVSPIVNFKPLTLFDQEILLKSLADLYAGGNISRTTYAEILGHNWDDETELRKKEKEKLTSLGLDEVNPSNKPGANNGDNSQNPNEKNPSVNKEKTKKSDINNNSNNKNGDN